MAVKADWAGKINIIFNKIIVMKVFLSYLIVFFLLTDIASAQNEKDSLTGTWTGTSLCQVKNSPCHDEIAVYHISKAAAANTYTIQMNKMVNGVEEEMATTDFIYDKSRQTLTGRTKDRQQRESVWEFVVKGNHMSGTLVLNDNTLYRKIEIDKK